VPAIKLFFTSYHTTSILFPSSLGPPGVEPPPEPLPLTANKYATIEFSSARYTLKNLPSELIIKSSALGKYP
jgi:hypothetical protein